MKLFEKWLSQKYLNSGNFCSLTPKELDELLFGKCDGCMMPCIKELCKELI